MIKIHIYSQINIYTMKISNHIINDIKSRITNGHPLPQKLTIANLAEAYNVSTTPVRIAIKALIDQNILIKHNNGRLEITKKNLKTADTIPTPTITNQTDAIFIQLSQVILKESLTSNEVFLREQSTSEQYNIGRTVVRQLFSKLAGAGMLEHIPRRGWLIRQYREEDMDAYLEVRETLELKSLDLAMPYLDTADLKKLLKGNTQTPNSNVININNDLHQYWINRSDNRYITEFFERHSRYYDSLFDYATIKNDVTKQMANQHCLIINALLNDQLDIAKENLVHHIRDQHPMLQRTLNSIR